MANEQYAAVMAALAAHGLALRKVDGKWETVEMPGGLSGLPPKLRGISIEFDVPKPKGSAGRGPSAGYNLQDKLAMTTDDYMLVYDDAKTILHRTHGIKLNDCLMKQDCSVVDHAVKKLVTLHSEFEAYRKLGFWPVRAFFYQILRIWSSKYQAASRSKDVAKVRKRRGRPAGKSSKATVPTGQPAIADPPALEENPVATTQPAPKALQGEDGDDDAEAFDLNIPSDDEDVPEETGLLDTTMGEATKLDLNPNATVNMSCDPRNDDNDDGR
ncbi:hypothetical protein FS749_011034 [Ceratobasidium sp. UAMH 11750]|nr:hypothetical protein FS749_011034 [Ceratobasidium sp. UAMH 11750]